MKPDFLYNTLLGRMMLKPLTVRKVSNLVGKYMDSPLSKRRISKFVRKNNIDMNEYRDCDYRSFNDFFTREIKDTMRLISREPGALIAPCDGLLSVYTIDENSAFKIKGSHYTVSELIQNEELAKQYYDGLILIFRLTVTDYHRYIYIDDGKKEVNNFIRGVLHTVQPIAQTAYKIYKTNSREWTILHTDNFGDVLQMEVGAMMVGRISNNHQKHSFKRGEEKGYFEFGGSTIVLMLKKDSAVVDGRFPVNDNEEIQVKMGEKIGYKPI